MSKNNKKDKERKRRQDEWEKDDKVFKRFREQAPYIKRLLNARGCTLPFYDLLDSYPEEFQRIAKDAKEKYSSLVGVYEVDDTIYYGHDYSCVGCGEYQKITFTANNDNIEDYGKVCDDANLNGTTTAFLDSEQRVRTVILIRKTVKNFREHKEGKYVPKIASLCHEIGHVHDIQNGINFKVMCKQVDIIEAEVFAHLFALETMAKRQLRQSFLVLENGLRKVLGAKGYLGEVARKVIDRLPEHRLVEWQAIMPTTYTKADLSILDSRGVEVMKKTL